MKQLVNSLSTPSGAAPDFIRQMMDRTMKPDTFRMDGVEALATLRLFSKTSFEIFKDESLQKGLEILCHTLLENPEIKKKDKKILSDFLSSFEFNYFILHKVLDDRRTLEQDMITSEEKTAKAAHLLEKFDLNTVKIQKLQEMREKLRKELEMVDVEFKVLEVDQGTVQADLLVLKKEFSDLPLKNRKSISRQQFIVSHSKSYTRFWDNFRLKARSMGRLV